VTVRGLWIAAPLLSFASVASAHLGHEVETAERYLKVDFGDDHVRVVVSLMLGPLEARRVLAIADRDGGDGDGTLTPAEADAYMAAWGEGLTTDLPLSLDGTSVEVQWEEPFLDPTGPISARPATVEMVARIPLTAGRHSLTVRDQMRRDTFDRTDVVFSAREGASLVASGPGEEVTDRVPAFAFASSQGPDVFTAVADVPGGSDAAGQAPNDDVAQPWVWLSAAVVVFALLALGFAFVRRRA
jgi:hypothetical protein